MDADKDWKKSVGFPINYSPENSDFDFDDSDVVMRRGRGGRHSARLLADEGDGAEADLLGTTPPRARIRDKNKRRTMQDMMLSPRVNKEFLRDSSSAERPRHRLSLKIQRTLDRDWKRSGGDKADSLPVPAAPATPEHPPVPTLKWPNPLTTKLVVESCSRFMSLSSRLKCRERAAAGNSAGEGSEGEEGEVQRRGEGLQEAPPSRVSFHKTFSMLINMGSGDKGCRRTISREEQVWQNELKDLIWLELQARIAGRSLAEQDVFLCAQRDIVPTVLSNIWNYRFVNPHPCRPPAGEGRGRRGREGGADQHYKRDSGTEFDDDGSLGDGCSSLSCSACSLAVGKALRELGALLDSYHRALALYPSSHALTEDHKQVATPPFQNKLKAMCLWYNTAMHMRLKVIAVRQLVRTMKRKQRRGLAHIASVTSRQSSTDSSRPCTVRFNLSTTPSSSNTSNNSEQDKEGSVHESKEGSVHDDIKVEVTIHGESNEVESSVHDETKEERSLYDENKDEERIHDESNEVGRVYDEIKEEGSVHDDSQQDGRIHDENEKEERVHDDTEEEGRVHDDSKGASVHDDDKEEVDSRTEPNKAAKTEQSKTDDRASLLGPGGVDEADSCDNNTDLCTASTPEIVLDSRYGTADTSESGYTSGEGGAAGGEDDVYDLGGLEDLAELKLLGKVDVSIYRSYHQEMLKTQGVRRCMMFINKMRHNLLHKVTHTLEPPTGVASEGQAEGEGRVFADAGEREGRDKDDEQAYELRRYGCLSSECVSMCLPSYRNHFLLLCCICMEAVHDYLSLRLEDRPHNPSCLTVKQLIHELKEGLDIAADMRAAFARNIHTALAGGGGGAGGGVRGELLQIVQCFDNTVETVLKQYLSYLRTMSAVEQMGRACLQAEWEFTAKLASRVQCAAKLAPHTFAEIACNQLEGVRKQFIEKQKQLKTLEKTEADSDKQYVYTICRAVQQVYASERDSAIHCAQWARSLAARLHRATPPYTEQRAAIAESLMKLRDLIVEQTRSILDRSRQISPDERDTTRDQRDVPRDNSRDADREALVARVRELLLQIYRLGFEIHKELHRFVHESHGRRAAAGAVRGAGRPRLVRGESVLDEGEGDERLVHNDSQTQSSIELFLLGSTPNPSPSPHSPPSPPECSLAERQLAERVARAVIEFAQCWMSFVVERCEKGRGLRPRWACQGLEFLMLACDPSNTRHLSEAEFERLKQQMDGCISHVIGCRPAPRPAPADSPKDARRRPRIHSPHRYGPSNAGGSGGELRGEAGGDVPVPPTPPTEPDPRLQFPYNEHSEYSRRVLAATAALERRREQQLSELGVVGRVLDDPVHTYEPKLRQLKFKWQRGLKIGAGSFGKVYTVVNTETGQLLAMKEISTAAGDRRALQRAANELRVLEGVIHPHLVRYYGCELHREEMLLFMELCVEGSLEALVATAGALSEHTVRRYTKQLLSALTELHARGIAHRDVKSGNIFLTNEGHCLKLGDFGCAVKIRATATAQGELIGHVGTQAYMAPEVFMKSTGHGRAADIWSLGCVVSEMASGKRPFSEYDSNVQIMFVVGMGGRPFVPETLSHEGRAFCLACLTHEPALRPTAEQLTSHHFLKLQSDEECQCLPAYLIT